MRSSTFITATGRQFSTRLYCTHNSFQDRLLIKEYGDICLIHVASEIYLEDPTATLTVQRMYSRLTRIDKNQVMYSTVVYYCSWGYCIAF